MTKITRGWPPKRRKEQAERMRKTKPWTKTTGPKTDEGKQAVRHNAYKHGFRSEDMKDIRRLLRAQRDFVKAVKSAQHAPCHDPSSAINLCHE